MRYTFIMIAIAGLVLLAKVNTPHIQLTAEQSQMEQEGKKILKDEHYVNSPVYLCKGSDGGLFYWVESKPGGNRRLHGEILSRLN